jgi:NADPH2:quinone reductase
MRAVVIEAMEQPPSVRDDVAAPQRGEGEVLIDVAAATLNPVELHIWRGRFRDGAPQVPYVPGIEGVGTVVEGGDCAPGTRVRFETVGLHPGYGHDGTLAERALAPAEIVTKLPDDLDDATAAALGTSSITALRMLEHVDLRLGDGVLVLGATGNVGRSAVQLAKAMGAGHVVAAGRDARGLERARELGADATVDLTGRSREEVVRALRDAAPDGIDIVADPLWGEPALAAIEAANIDVRLVNVGRAAGDPIALAHPLMLRKRATIMGLSTAMDPTDVRRAAFLRLLDHVAAGRLVVDHDVVGLDAIGDAWQRLAAGAGRKLVVRIRA